LAAVNSFACSAVAVIDVFCVIGYDVSLAAAKTPLMPPSASTPTKANVINFFFIYG